MSYEPESDALDFSDAEVIEAYEQEIQPAIELLKYSPGDFETAITALECVPQMMRSVASIIEILDGAKARSQPA